MYENFAWKQFLITGNVETFLEYRKLMALNGNDIYGKRDELINETNQGERNSNSRGSI